MNRPTKRASLPHGAAELLVLRRTALRGGLAGFAALMAPLLPGCGDDGATTGGSGGAGGAGGAGPGGAGGAGGGDAGFPLRDVPPAPALRSRIAEVGPLGDPDANGVRLPGGFTARIVAISEQRPVASGDHAWHFAPDGGATFPTEDGGWIYVSNSEVPIVGGAGALRFDASGTLVSSTSILADTAVNCAGGRTPWHTWLSCEETPNGRVFECDPWGEHPAVARPALGVFKHEAVAVDVDRGHLYLTEDVEDGRLYRFTADRQTSAGFPDLSAGLLEVAVVADDGGVTWAPVPDPLYAGSTPTREQVPASTPFSGGEGIWFHRGVVYFSTKGDNRVRALDVEAAQMRVIYDLETSEDPILSGVDNLTVSCCGDVLVAEDGGDMQIVAILPDGSLRPLVQIVGHDGSEITGPAFDPSGTRLYFSSQRGPEGGGGGGVTYEVTGPFHAPA